MWITLWLITIVASYVYGSEYKSVVATICSVGKHNFASILAFLCEIDTSVAFAEVATPIQNCEGKSREASPMVAIINRE